MKYLILGSSGQIGSALSEYLTDRGHQVAQYDIVLGHEYDLRSMFAQDKLGRCMDEADFVFFLAFDVGGSKYLRKYQDTYEFIDNNTAIMRNVFYALQYYDKPFVFASSQMSNMVDSPYGVLKALGEHYTRSLDGISVKFWNVYGIERDPAKTHVITDLVLKAYQGKIDVESSGDEERQFLHANDCCEALYGLSQNYGNWTPEEPYDVTSYEWTTIKNVAEIISNQFGGIPITYGKRTDLHTIKNEPKRNMPNWWHPRITLEAGISDIIKYYAIHNGKNPEPDNLRNV